MSNTKVSQKIDILKHLKKLKMETLFENDEHKDNVFIFYEM